MPFGKNKKLSAPRPKKKKVVLIVEEPEEAFEEEESEAAAANPSSTTDTKDSVISSLAVPESPGKLLREEASQLNDDAVHDMCEAENVAQEADTQLQIALRLYKVKMKRLDVYERKKSRYSPYTHLDRIYKARTELDSARLACSEGWRDAAEAEARAMATLVNVKTLEIARLKRELRRCKRNRRV